ncbi:MAG: hypothetical protein AB7F31_05475 [Parachlamydiales bacterium]
MAKISGDNQNIQPPNFEKLEKAQQKYDFQHMLKTVLLQALASDIIKSIKKMSQDFKNNSQS